MRSTSLVLTVLAGAFITACTSTVGISYLAGTDCLPNLKKFYQQRSYRVAHSHHAEASVVREDGIKETALSLGSQAGLAWRAKCIDKELLEHEKNLDHTYNFYGMLLKNDILPPVLAQGNNTLNLASDSALRLSDRVYRIISQARFVTAPPTWRDYLWMDYVAPPNPDVGLLPRNAAEKKLWDYYVTIGWNNGIKQANDIFATNLARLNRDYKGMVLYRKLYAQNMVSAPFVAKTDLGITGDSEQMRINDQVLRITALPQLNLQGESWNPAIVPTHPATESTQHLDRKYRENAGSGVGLITHDDHDRPYDENDNRDSSD